MPLARLRPRGFWQVVVVCYLSSARLTPKKAGGRGLPVCDAGGRVARGRPRPQRRRDVGSGQGRCCSKNCGRTLLKFGADGPGVGQRRPVARAEAGRFIGNRRQRGGRVQGPAAARPQCCVKAHPGGGEGARARPERGRGPGERDLPRLFRRRAAGRVPPGDGTIVRVLRADLPRGAPRPGPAVRGAHGVVGVRGDARAAGDHEYGRRGRGGPRRRQLGSGLRRRLGGRRRRRDAGLGLRPSVL